MRKRRFLTVAIGLVLSLLSSRAIAAPNLAKLTGNLADIWGLAANNATVTFQSNGGNFQGTIVPPTYFSVITDAQGNLPSSPTGPPPVHFQCSNLLQTNCDVQLPYSARVNVSFQSAFSNQSGGPYGIQICDAPVCDLGLLIKLSKDPPSVVTAVTVNGGGDYILTAANPPAGSFGTTVLQPGRVFALQNTPICTTTPTTGQDLQFNGTQWCAATGSQPIIDITLYGAKSSIQTATCSGTAGNSTVTCTGGDFVKNDGIAIPGAAATPSVAAPASLLITNETRVWAETGTVPGGGGTVTTAHAANFDRDSGVTYGKTPSSAVMPELPFTYGTSTGQYTEAAGVYTFPAGDANQPVLLSYVWNDTSGGDTHIYSCAAFDSAYALTASVSATTNTSAATLSSLHYNHLGCDLVTGAAGYAFWKDGHWLGSVGPDLNLSVAAASNATPISVTTSTDHGLFPGDPVVISGVLGNTAANGVFTVLTTPLSNTFTIGATGNGAYGGGGTVSTGAGFDDYLTANFGATGRPSSQVRPWFWPDVPPTAAVPAPLIGATSTSSVTITALNGSAFTLSTAPTSTFTSQTAIHDNTSKFAAANAAAILLGTGGNNIGATLVVPPGSYNGDWVPSPGVGIQCVNPSITPSFNSAANPTYLVHVRPGQPLIDMSTASYEGGIEKCGLTGIGAGGIGDVGILTGATTLRPVIRQTSLNQFGDQGIYLNHVGGGASNAVVMNNIVGNAVLNRNRLAPTGAFQAAGTDDIVIGNEFTTSSSGEGYVSSPRLFVDACVVNAGAGFYTNNDCEVSDVGMFLQSLPGVTNPTNLHLTGNRFDLNMGHGVYVPTGSIAFNSMWATTDLLSNGKDGALTGIFDQMHGAFMGTITGLSFSQPSGGSIRHGIWDSTSSQVSVDSYSNITINGTGTNPIESFIQTNPTAGATFSLGNNAPATQSRSGVAFAGLVVPDVSLLTEIIPANGSPTTITNFCNGPAIVGVCQPEASGRTIQVLGDANTTIKNGTNIFTLEGADEVLRDLKYHTFLKQSDAWYEVGGSPDDHFGVSGNLGGLTSTPADTLLQDCTIATTAGHFVDLVCTDDFNTACTTAPSFKPRNDTAATVGSVVNCSNTAGQVTATQTLAFAAGDRICIVRTTNGGTCTAPNFSVEAHLNHP